MILANNETDLLVYTFKDKMCTVKCTCICHSVYLEIYTASTQLTAEQNTTVICKNNSQDVKYDKIITKYSHTKKRHDPA